MGPRRHFPPPRGSRPDPIFAPLFLQANGSHWQDPRTQRPSIGDRGWRHGGVHPHGPVQQSRLRS
ncbi:MAG: hypothetical protein ACK56I_18955, partial [bacterium]